MCLVGFFLWVVKPIAMHREIWCEFFSLHKFSLKLDRIVRFAHFLVLLHSVSSVLCRPAHTLVVFECTKPWVTAEQGVPWESTFGVNPKYYPSLSDHSQISGNPARAKQLQLNIPRGFWGFFGEGVVHNFTFSWGYNHNPGSLSWAGLRAHHSTSA